ncbi:oxidoreductase [Rickenella mellea]|uniref:Oxidoreductase n=1 Tax=Rickenella mellea TaxID=50990 RepID=A0A4Y7QMF6_9AGAM|nr:oxidoreductase [Rickenella mellea]
MENAAKVVIVTGCSKGGIGFHLCEQFAEKGCKVYATARRIESMEGFKHAGIRRLQLDVTSDEDVQNAVNNVVEAEGKVDIVVNNAGVICIGPVIDVPMEQVHTTFDTNLYSVVRMARAVVPHMAIRKQGLIINVSSITAEIPTPWNGVYAASKAATHSLSEVLEMECKPLGVNVMLVVPGPIKSNIADNHSKIFILPPASLYKQYLDQIVQRMYTSQGQGSMPTAAFARQVVSKAMRSQPPRYVMLGGPTYLYTLLKWMPRAFVLWLMWRKFSQKR